MKVFLAALLFLTMIFFRHAAVSFAGEHSLQDIQTLKDAAAALKTSNPGLSGKLSEYAEREAGETEEAEEKEEGEGNGAGNIKLLNDSAAALKQSNPPLADALKKFADEETKEEQEEKEK